MFISLRNGAGHFPAPGQDRQGAGIEIDFSDQPRSRAATVSLQDAIAIVGDDLVAGLALKRFDRPFRTQFPLEVSYNFV